MMVVLGMLGLFAVVSYQPLLQLMSYVPWSKKTSRDRSALVVAERTLVDGLRKSVDGYLWAHSTGGSTSVLMGQALHYRGPKEPPVTAYAFYHWDKKAEMLWRWRLEPGVVIGITGALSPASEVPPAAWTRLAAIRENKSVVATHVLGFKFDLGAPTAPLVMEIQASSFAEDKPKAGRRPRPRPVQQIRREMTKVNDER
jgi:hypothetical protein